MLLDAVTAYVNVVRDAAIVRLRENDVTVETRKLVKQKQKNTAANQLFKVPMQPKMTGCC